jgi:PAS domain S-box-containing protein
MGNPLRFLLLEDEPADAELMLRELARQGFAFTHVRVATYDAFVRALGEPRPDVILSDYGLPGFDGSAALRAAVERCPETPFIFVTGTLGEERAIELVKAGATDYVLKEGLHRLGPALRRALREKEERDARRRAEEALRESEERYRRLAELAPDPLLVQAEGKIVYINPAGWRLLGARGPDEILGLEIADIVHPESHEVVRARIAAIESDRQPVPFVEEKYVRRDGSTVLVEVAAVPIDLGGRIAVQVFVRDITARKNLEEQLRQAQKLEAVGQLAGGVAHDFNNLLTVILGYSQILLLGMDPSNPAHEDIAQIQKAASRAATLTGQLLAFSRRQVSRPRTLRLNEILAEMEKMLRRLIREDIELALVLREDVGFVRADPGLLEQVVMNLVVNARDAMADGGKLLIETANASLDEAYAAAHPGASPGAYVMLSVSDTGCGMDAATKSRLFEPFFTTKARGKGTGLGLSTVYGIVRQCGGHITVASEPGKGTTFRIHVPRIGEAPRETTEATAPRALARGSETVLLVEDEPALRKLAADALRRAGYEVLEAANGEDAILVAEARSAPVDLVVTDVVMPGIGGVDLARRLRARASTARVLYMSGYSDDPDLRRGEIDESEGLLAKPFTVDQLLRRVRECLDTKARPRHAEEPAS